MGSVYHKDSYSPFLLLAKSLPQHTLNFSFLSNVSSLKNIPAQNLFKMSLSEERFRGRHTKNFTDREC